MAEWRNGRMVEWWNGEMTEWRNGGMAEWRNGGMAEWHNVLYKIVRNQNTESTQMPPWQSPSWLVLSIIVRYPLSNYVGIWREMHLEAHASGNACVSEVDPKSQLPYVWKRTHLGS